MDNHYGKQVHVEQDPSLNPQGAYDEKKKEKKNAELAPANEDWEGGASRPDQPQKPKGAEYKVDTIDRDELWQKMNRKEPIQVINVLSAKYENLGMIAGSKRMPLEELDQRTHELDSQREVVTYCAGYHCDASQKAAEKLVGKGFSVRAYEGGIEEWKDSGLPTAFSG